MARAAALIVTSVAMAASTLASGGPAGEEAGVGTLGLDEPLFWTGPVVSGGLESDGIAPPLGEIGELHCAPGQIPESMLTVPCINYTIDVEAGGTMLRVAIDHPSNIDHFGLSLRDPSGAVVGTREGSPLPVLPAAANGFNFSSEIFVPDPMAGTWTLTVIVHDVVRSAFRLRALLEGEPAPPVGDEPLLPNLQAMPPMHIGFGECAPTEAIQHGATRCLRFSQGPLNVGDGPLELVIRDTGTPGSDSNGQPTLVGTHYQRVHHADGTITEVPAGSYEYHVQHAHYHHAFTGLYQLYRAHPAEGTMDLVSTSPKQGFCMGDFLLADWGSFGAEEALHWSEASFGPNCLTPVLNLLHLSTGWGDSYLYGTEGNYVDFGDEPDGLYVIKARANFAPDGGPNGDILETSYEDNESYAYIEVCGDVVDVLERGRGSGPFALNRVVVDDGRQAALADPKTYEAPARRC